MAKRRLADFAIKKSKAKEFIDEMDKNRITKSFLNECKRVSKLFKRK